MRILPRLLSLGAAVLVLSFAGGNGSARADTDPAIAQLQAFDQSLIDTMKQAKALGTAGRYRALAPVIERTFDLRAMTQFAVGATWTTMSEAEHQALIKAFTRLTVASYAHNFDDFNGEHFDVDSKVDVRGPDKVVQARMIPTSGDPVSFVYRMRQSGRAWKVIDVYYGSISQLTTRRSDFAASVASGGAPALIAHLNELSDKLMKS
jgi:phospholipid transport system substrate-binding protein